MIWQNKGVDFVVVLVPNVENVRNEYMGDTKSIRSMGHAEFAEGTEKWGHENNSGACSTHPTIC